MSADATYLPLSEVLPRGRGPRGAWTHTLRIDYKGGTRPRDYGITDRQDALTVATITGAPFTSRDMAARLGYSSGGVIMAMQRLASWGACRIVSVRGRLGYTRLIFSRDVRRGGRRILARVPPIAPVGEPVEPASIPMFAKLVEPADIEPVSIAETFGELMARHGFGGFR